MPLVKEDGSVVANANTFVTTEDVLAYATDRNKLDTWEDADAEQQVAAILAAADFLRNEERFPYRGVVQTYGQTMPWPRTGAQERRGPLVPSDVVPWRLKEAQCELALKALSADLQPDQDRGGQVQTKTVDVLTTTWFAGAPSETTRVLVMGLLKPLLRDAKVDNFSMMYDGPDDAGPYEPDVFTNRNG